LDITDLVIPVLLVLGGLALASYYQTYPITLLIGVLLFIIGLIEFVHVIADENRQGDGTARRN
jgi:uncharacterized membrane protein HdeD (DUF308 family)